MNFIERRIEATEHGELLANPHFTYTVEDLFGTIVIASKDQLDAKKLDSITVGIMQSGMIRGNVTPEITFTFDKAPTWIKDEEPKIVADQSNPAEHPKARGIAFILCLFLGGFGAHRFYVGKNGTAIIQLCLTLTFIGALISGPWALIDLIVILCGTFKDKDGMTLSAW